MLKKIRLEMARSKEFPDGSKLHGYELVAPLTKDGHLDLEAWKSAKEKCWVHRFWQGQADERGFLQHKRTRWVFSYVPGEDDDEPAFRLGEHVFRPGEYVSITEHDGVQRTFVVASVA